MDDTSPGSQSHRAAFLVAALVGVLVLVVALKDDPRATTVTTQTGASTIPAGSIGPATTPTTAAPLDHPVSLPSRYDAPLDMPAGGGTGVAYRVLGPVAQADAEALAGAVGLQGPVQRGGATWQIGANAHALTIFDGLGAGASWLYTSGPGVAQGFSPDPRSAGALPPGAVDEAEARRLAGAILVHAGFDATSLIQTLATGEGWHVTARPRFGGLLVEAPADVLVGPQGRIVFAGGFLINRPEPMGGISLESTSTALAAMNQRMVAEQSNPEMLAAPPGPPTEVTSVELVLVQAGGGGAGDSYFVPGYRFHGADGSTVDQPAVDPRTLPPGG